MLKSASKAEKEICYHCGDDCLNEKITIDEKHFCCNGCKTVFEIINKNGLCEYYDLSKNPGINQKIKIRDGRFSFLDNEEIATKLIHFSEGSSRHVTFYLPQMHCSSCIWLLEHLSKLNEGVVRSTVNFLKKEVTIIFNSDKTDLRAIAELLTSVGYEPHISLNDLKGKKTTQHDRNRIIKLGVAGFCFGNIMLLSFPEYFSSGEIDETYLKNIFSYLNLVLSLPVFFYCASGFFISAFKGLKHRFLNIDAPIALAILITFGRSVYEILSHTGAGYLDSMSGIVFFMLIGRYFQDRTYESVAFDRDYTSYFPIGVTVLSETGEEKQIPVSDLKKGHRVWIHSNEIIPADGILFLGQASIDYSFVTGESLPVEKTMGEIIYAGGKQTGGAIELEIVKEVSQSYLTQLWNNEIFKKEGREKKISYVHRLSRYFTYILFSIAIVTGIYWSMNDSIRTWNAVTAILIVACPCALLLSATFTNGTMLGRLRASNFFVRNSEALEALGEADTIVFDKTGTLTMQGTADVRFESGVLTEYERQLVRAVAEQSNHPLSKAVVSQLPFQKRLPVKYFIEEKGKGSSALVNKELVKIGSAEFVTGSHSWKPVKGSYVFVSVNNELLGYFHITTTYRPGLEALVRDLRRKYRIALLSGDNNSEEPELRKIFGAQTEMLFGQNPQAKLDYIKNLRLKGRKVIMIGDGLNDAGALQQSDAGIAVTDDINNFTPGSDAILEGKQFTKLEKLLEYCRVEKKIVAGSFIISILYNIVGMYFAVQGNLSPVIAAILMPLSSVSIVLYTTLLSSFSARKINS